MAQHRPSRPVVLATNLSTLLLVLGAAFAVFFVFAAVAGAVSGGHGVTVHQEVDTDQLASLPDAVVVPGTVPVTVRIDDASPQQVFLDLGRNLIVIVMSLVGLWLVRGLLLSVRQGDPFTAVNVRRLRAGGFLLVIGAPVALYVTQMLESALAVTSPVGELSTRFNIPGPGPFIGLGVFVLAEVFAHGVRLREDVEGTV
jgi:hypothetical protein